MSKTKSLDITYRFIEDELYFKVEKVKLPTLGKKYEERLEFSALPIFIAILITQLAYEQKINIKPVSVSIFLKEQTTVIIINNDGKINNLMDFLSEIRRDMISKKIRYRRIRELFD